MPAPPGRTRALLLALALTLTACGVDEPTEDPAVPPATATEGDRAEADAPAPAQPTPAPDDDPAPDDSDQPPAEVEVEQTDVATDLEVPWGVAFTDDGTAYVSERDRGVLSRLTADGSVEEVQAFEVDAAGEGGLLGVAVSPTFAEDGLLYVYYTSAQDNRVVRFTPGEAPEEVVTGIEKGRVHNGGRIAFGPDGLLYVATGDAGDPALSQDDGALAGKILRVTAAGEVPDDNPTQGSPVYASGLRNVQGLAWDADGTLLVSEFGPDVDDALLRVEAGSDQGWGPDVANAGAGSRVFPDPIDVRQPPEASWSGITVLRDGAIPQWEGDLFVTALRGQRLWRYDAAGEGDADALLEGELGRLREVVQAPDGALWVLTSNRDGRGTPAEGDDRIVRLGPAG